MPAPKMTDTTGEEELRILFQKVARRIRNNRADDALSDSQLGVLFKLENEAHSPSELAAHERVTPPSMNRTLNGLEKAGLVERTPSGDDARRVRVSITAAGLAQIAETRALRTAWFSRQLASLPAEDRAALYAATEVLRKLADA